MHVLYFTFSPSPLPGLVKVGFQRPGKAEVKEETLARDSFDQVGLTLLWNLRTKVEGDGTSGILVEGHVGVARCAGAVGMNERTDLRVVHGNRPELINRRI